MSSLLSYASEFVRKLNAFILASDPHDPSTVSRVLHLRERIASLVSKVSRSETRAQELLTRMSDKARKPCDVIYLREGGLLRGIISDTIEKVRVWPCEPLTECCECDIFPSSEDVPIFPEPSSYSIVETEEELVELDAALDTVYLQVFDHDFRSYNGFTCIITILVSSGILYVIDALKFREMISRSRLLRCHVKKVVHCERCVERLIKDFGSIGCYRCFYAASEDRRFIDWRIRPLNDTFVSIMFEGMLETLERVHSGVLPLRFEEEKRDENAECEDFADAYDIIDENKREILRELLCLRRYLAARADEGLQYVMTDKQVYTLLEGQPTTISEFEETLLRMSPVARRHIGDFLLILERRTRGFSISRLLGNFTLEDRPSRLSPPEENPEELPERFRSFEKSSEREA